MSEELPLVSVVIPARDEEPDIEECIAAVAAQDYPLGRIEVIVVDGGSGDRTAELAEKALASVPFERGVVLDNPVGTTPSNLNRGLAEATGEYLCRVDARSVIPVHYVRTCVEVLRERPEVAVVGGSQVARTAAGSTAIESAIARALRNPYVTGFARYRRARSSGATDTVYLGAFRVEQLRRAGGWDERYRTNQDYELNRRLGVHGAVWYDARLEVGYRPRSSLPALAAQYRRFGRWKAAGWVEGDVPVRGRHVVMVLGPPLSLAAAGALVRRRPGAAVAGIAVTALLLDRSGERGGSATERLMALLPSIVVPTAWWIGAVEQLLRRVLGGRMLGHDTR